MTTRKRNAKGEGSRLREEILGAALDLLRETGAEAGVTVRSVARRTGMAPQSFYLHFPSVGALLFELYRSQYDTLETALRAAVADAEDAPAALRGACAAYLGFARHHGPEYALLFETRGGTPAWPEGRPGDTLTELFRGLLDGVGVRDTRTELALLWASLHGLALLGRDRPAYPWPSEDVLLDRLLAPLLGPARPAGGVSA